MEIGLDLIIIGLLGWVIFNREKFGSIAVLSPPPEQKPLEILFPFSLADIRRVVEEAQPVSITAEEVPAAVERPEVRARVREMAFKVVQDEVRNNPERVRKVLEYRRRHPEVSSYSAACQAVDSGVE